MDREKLVKGVWYAAKEYDTITCVQVLDLSPWMYDEHRNLVPGDTGIHRQNILIFTESGELDILHEDEIVTTWDDHTALSRWLKAEQKWKAEQLSHKIMTTTHVLRDVLKLSGIKVDVIRWNEPFAEISIRLDLKETK